MAEQKDEQHQDEPERGRTPLTARVYQSALDQQIARAMAEGQFDNLPGQGQPQKLDDDTLVPEDLRTGFRLLKASGFAPPWIEVRKDVDEERAKLADWLARANARWQYLDINSRTRLRAEYRRKLDDLHRMVLTYNLTAPRGVEHLVNVDIQAELCRLGQP